MNAEFMAPYEARGAKQASVNNAVLERISQASKKRGDPAYAGTQQRCLTDYCPS